MTELVADYSELKNLVESHGEAKNCSVGINKCEKCQRIKELRKRVYPPQAAEGAPNKKKFTITDAKGEKFTYYSYRNAVLAFGTNRAKFKDFLFSGEYDKCFIEAEEINKAVNYTKVNKTLYREKEVVTVEKDDFQKDFLSIAKAGEFLDVNYERIRSRLRKGEFLHS